MCKLPELVEEKLESVVEDPSVRDFIKNTMCIEQKYKIPNVKIEEYKKKLEKYVERE